MTKHMTAYLGMGLLLFVSGCAICANPYDSHFAAHGGSWERDDPSNGRVASVFDPAGPMVQRQLDEGSPGTTPSGLPPRTDEILLPEDSGRGYLDEDPPPDLDSLLPEWNR
jgi:hypothetical protein